MEKFNIKSTLPSLILGLSLILSFVIGSVTFYKVRSLDNYLSVTGSATKNVISDSAKFSGTFSRVVKISNIKGGYSTIASDLDLVKKFLKSQGIAESDAIFSTVSMMQNYDYYQNGQTEKEYTISQTVEISSSDVAKISSVAQNIKQLIDLGVIFSTNPVEYYYTKLPELRVDLLSDAIKDAKARAGKLAESSGQGVGSLKSASTGVVQVLPSNSLEISDYGTYDTSKVNKTVMITVKASFNLK
ncbi:MAG: SIMPL domain-containing protein [Minisyncoccia bacterium]